MGILQHGSGSVKTDNLDDLIATCVWVFLCGVSTATIVSGFTQIRLRDLWLKWIGDRLGQSEPWHEECFWEGLADLRSMGLVSSYRADEASVRLDYRLSSSAPAIDAVAVDHIVPLLAQEARERAENSRVVQSMLEERQATRKTRRVAFNRRLESYSIEDVDLAYRGRSQIASFTLKTMDGLIRIEGCSFFQRQSGNYGVSINRDSRIHFSPDRLNELIRGLVYICFGSSIADSAVMNELEA